MLSVPCKYRIEFSHCSFQIVGTECRLRFAPHIFDEFSVILHKFAFGAQRIVLVDFLIKVLLDKIVSQQAGIRQALQTAIHETSVAQIRKPNFPQCAIWTNIHFHFFIDLLLFGKFAVPDMKSSISLLTFLTAIGDCLAPTDEGQFFVFVTVLAFLFVCGFEEICRIFV